MWPDVCSSGATVSIVRLGIDKTRKELLCLLSFFFLLFPLFRFISTFLCFFILLPLFYFSILLLYLSLFRSIFVFSCFCLFFRPSHRLFGLCFPLSLSLSLSRPVTIETCLHIATRKLSMPSVVRFICIISTIDGCSKSAEFIRRECRSFIAWPQGYIGFRSRDNMCR